jgi:hypothetical protein
MREYKYFDENFQIMKDSITEDINLMRLKGASDQEILDTFIEVTIDIYAELSGN